MMETMSGSSASSGRWQGDDYHERPSRASGADPIGPRPSTIQVPDVGLPHSAPGNRRGEGLPDLDHSDPPNLALLGKVRFEGDLASAQTFMDLCEHCPWAHSPPASLVPIGGSLRYCRARCNQK